MSLIINVSTYRTLSNRWQRRVQKTQKAQSDNAQLKPLMPFQDRSKPLLTSKQSIARL